MSIIKDVNKVKNKKVNKEQVEMINQLKEMGLLNPPKNVLANNLDYIDIPPPYIGTNSYTYQNK